MNNMITDLISRVDDIILKLETDIENEEQYKDELSNERIEEISTMIDTLDFIREML